MLERFDETDCKCGLPVTVEASPEGDLVRYADAHATIADLRGQAKDYQACRDVLDSTVLELTQVQQRVAQLEALLDTHKTEYRAVLQSKAKEIDEIQADCVKLRDRVTQLEGENKALVDAHRDFRQRAALRSGGVGHEVGRRI